MKTLVLALLILTAQVNATEIYLGYGVPYKADRSGSDIKTFSIERNKWKVELSRLQEYTLSWWNIKKFSSYPLIKIKKHSTLSVSRNVYQYDFDHGGKFYFDFGAAYSTELSRATSSRFLFHEAIGYQYGWLRVEFNHRSNAGTGGKNAGEDGIYLKFLLWGDE